MTDSTGMDFSGKRVVVLGLARQGIATARYLAQAGAEVVVSDLQSKAALADALAELEGLPIQYALGKHPLTLLNKTDLLCLSGGVPLDAPIVVEARKRGIPLSNDAQLFLERCPAPVIGVTGSAGKTTTTTLLGEICRAAGFRTWVGGNIGNPLLGDLGQIQPSDRVVMELSSFQLEIMTRSPQIAAVLNITPNHLDRHKTMEAYIAAKRPIIAHQRADDVAVLGYDDANARALAIQTPARLAWFSGRAEIEEGAFKTNGDLTLRHGGQDVHICKAAEVRLRGRHNLLNILAACAVAAQAGAPVEAMRQVATTFTGVAHRLEPVREWNGVWWYDDSIATAPERTLAALRSFDEPLILLAGGRDKKLPWDEFAAEAVRRVRHLVTFGEAGGMITQVVEDARGKMQEAGDSQSPIANRKSQIANSHSLMGITQVETLEEAVAAAARLARPGDVVLLSPGGTSFDAFKDFEERGERFKELVRGL